MLDTSFVIDFLNNHSGAVSYFWKLAEKKDPYSISVITIYELRAGLRKSPHREKHTKFIETIETTANILPIDFHAISIASELQDVLSSKGAIIGDFDILISATCLVHNERLVTRNVRDFDRIKDLKIESY